MRDPKACRTTSGTIRQAHDARTVLSDFSRIAAQLGVMISPAAAAETLG